MHAYLLISKNDSDINAKAQDLAQKQEARLSPFTIQKIADVRDLGQYTKLSLSEKTAFFIEHVEKITPDAANAFLKQLEEPKTNVLFILSATSEDKVLPTIVSRCQVIRIASTGVYHDKDEDLDSFLNGSSGERLSIVDKIKKREEAIVFVESILHDAHKNLIANALNTDTNVLEEAQKTLTSLEKNGNVTIQLTRFVVALSRR